MLVDVGCNSFQVHSVSKPQASPKRAAKKGGWASFRHQHGAKDGRNVRWHPCLLPQTIAVSVKTWGKHGKTPLKYLGIMINEQKRNHVSMQYATSPLRAGRTRLSCWKSPVLCHCVAVVCVMRSGILFCNSNHKQGFGDISLHQPLLPKWWFSYLWLLIWYPAQHAFYLFLCRIYV